MATSESHRSEDETIERLPEALRELPEVNAHGPMIRPMGHGDRDIDAETEFNTGDRGCVLLIDIRKSVYPRDAQQVLWRLDRHMAAGHAERRKRMVAPLAAESISPGARDLPESRKRGFPDTGGSLFIPVRGAYVCIERPPPKTLRKSVRGLFRGRRPQVLHALLIRRDGWFGVEGLAESAGASPAKASERLPALERLAVKGQGPSKERGLTAPGALLDGWRKRTLAAPRRRECRRFHVPAGDPEAIANRLVLSLRTARSRPSVNRTGCGADPCAVSCLRSACDVSADVRPPRERAVRGTGSKNCE